MRWRWRWVGVMGLAMTACGPAVSSTGRAKFVPKAQPSVAAAPVATLPPRDGLLPGSSPPASALPSPSPSPAASVVPSQSPKALPSEDPSPSPSVRPAPSSVPVNLGAWQVQTLSGAEPGFADGGASEARFHNPNGLAVQGQTLWVADTDNHRIRRLDLATGQVSTWAGTGVMGGNDGPRDQAQFNSPLGLDSTPGGDLFVADTGNHLIRRVTATGGVSPWAGSVEGLLDGQGSAARCSRPFALCHLPDGALVVVDSGNDRLRRISEDQNVITMPGLGTRGYTDGPLGQSQWSVPSDVVPLPNQRLAVADFGNKALRVVDLVNQTVETWLGPSTLVGPTGVAVDPQGRVWVADADGHRLYRVSGKDQVDLRLGGATPGALDGPAGQASFQGPSDLVVLSDGRIVVADAGNHRLRMVLPAP